MEAPRDSPPPIGSPFPIPKCAKTCTHSFCGCLKDPEVVRLPAETAARRIHRRPCLPVALCLEPVANLRRDYRQNQHFAKSHADCRAEARKGKDSAENCDKYPMNHGARRERNPEPAPPEFSTSRRHYNRGRQCHGGENEKLARQNEHPAFQPEANRDHQQAIRHAEPFCIHAESSIPQEADRENWQCLEHSPCEPFETVSLSPYMFYNARVAVDPILTRANRIAG